MLDDSEVLNDKYSNIIDLFKKNKFENIIQEIASLEEDAFENPFLLNLLGATYLNLNDKKNAKVYFTHALAIEPNYREAIINLGNLEYNNKSYQKNNKRRDDLSLFGFSIA